jgi:flagellar hook-associated protein 1 FlgK
VGYSRQEATLTASLPLTIPAGMQADGTGAQLGSGVEVEAYRRVRDMFLDVQYRAQNTMLGDADARANALEGVELSLAEPTDNGLQKQLDKLWSAWSTLSGDPTNVAARTNVVEQAKTVAKAFAEVDGQLSTIRKQAADELAALTKFDPATGVYGEIGQLANELAQVGAAIRDAVITGQAPNDLMDHRDLLLDKLSTYGNVQTVDLGDGGLRVMFGGTGTPLVDDGLTDDPGTPGDQRVAFDPAALLAPGGKLGALKALSEPGGTIDGYRTELASVVQTLASTVNAVHAQAPAATDFFTFDPALGASGLSVAVTAASVQTGTGGAAGSNDLALQLGAMTNGAAAKGYQAFVARIGTDTKQNLRTQANAATLLDAVEDRRQSTMGVSLDEEMTNLVRFQRGYQASARTMSTLDEMLETLINRTGRVGL